MECPRTRRPHSAAGWMHFRAHSAAGALNSMQGRKLFFSFNSMQVQSLMGHDGPTQKAP